MTATVEVPALGQLARDLEERYERRLIDQFFESKLNPRKTFHEAKLLELAASIREKGVIEPLVARPAPRGEHLEIIAGARRFRAAKLAGLSHLPVVVRAYTDAQAIEIMAIENGQRDDVPPLEEAAGYKQLMLVDKTYTAAMIAGKIGRSEKYVWDRLRLLELVVEIRELLVSGEIGVEHAEIIAKLKPSEQKSLLKTRGYTGESGLFEHDTALAFDDNPDAKKKRKPVSVRELREFIARNIRLDIKHAAATAPLEFGVSAERVQEAEAQPGRGKKVVPITFSWTCPDGAKDPNERTYGSESWKKAENKDGEATCDYAVLGLVVAGEKYGQSFKVCIARDRCRTHWAEVVKAKEKAAKQRDSGKPKQADRTEAKAREKEEQRRREEEATRKRWEKLQPLIVDEAIAQVRAAKALTAAQAKFIESESIDVWDVGRLLKQRLGANWFKNPAGAWLVVLVDTNNPESFDDYVKEIAKPLGLDLKRLQAIRDKHQPKPDPKPAPAKASTKKKKAAA